MSSAPYGGHPSIGYVVAVVCRLSCFFMASTASVLGLCGSGWYARTIFEAACSPASMREELYRLSPLSGRSPDYSPGVPGRPFGV